MTVISMTVFHIQMLVNRIPAISRPTIIAAMWTDPLG